MAGIRFPPTPSETPTTNVVQQQEEHVAAVVEAAAPEMPAIVIANACGMCARPVTNKDDRMVRGRCDHVYHVACMTSLIAAGRQYCMQCPLARTNEAASEHGGYSIDTGNDADVRESIGAALEYRRNQVRDDFIARASVGALLGERTDGSCSHAPATANRTSGNSAVASDEELLYVPVPHEAGGLPEIDPPRFKSDAEREAATKEARRLAERRTCTLVSCGGERFCVHRHLITIESDAVLHWRYFDAPLPIVDSDIARARDAIFSLLEHRASPSTWARCGASAEALAVAGLTLDDLVRHSTTLLEHVVDGLELTWERLQMLGFHPSLLEHRDDFPVVVLARAGLDATRLLRSCALSYKDLVDRFRLSHEELCFLGFDGAMLMQLGMQGEDILNALSHEHIRARGPAWWVKAMRMTPELLDRAFARYKVALLSNEDKVAYASLVVATRTARA